MVAVRRGGKVPYTSGERLQRALELGIIVDEEDKWLLSAYTWSIHSSGFPTTWLYIERKQYIVYLHHCIMGQAAFIGDECCNLSGDRLNNRRNNLRIMERTHSKHRNSNVVRARHVMFDMRSKSWHVKVRRDNISYALNYLKSEEEAKAARDEWQRLYELHGDQTWTKLSGAWHITKRASLPRVSRHLRVRSQSC